MKILLTDYETKVEINDNKVSVLEILNRKLFYDVTSCFVNISNGVNDDYPILFTDNDEEVNLNRNIAVYLNYFEIEYNSKNVLTKLYDRVNSELNEEDKNKIQLLINDIMKLYNTYISNIDLDLEYNDSLSFVDICKLLKLKVKDNTTNILEKMMLIIDIESQLHLNKLVVFVNLKQYLNKEDLDKLYEYILAKKVNVLLLENSSIDYENNDEVIYKIDNDFDEYIS